MPRQLIYLCKGLVLTVLLLPYLALSSAMALELQPAVAPEDVALFDLLAALVGGESAAKWITLAGFGCWILTQVLAWLPPSWLAKLPDWLIALIKVMGGNYRNSANGLVNDPQEIRRANTAAAKPAR